MTPPKVHQDIKLLTLDESIVSFDIVKRKCSVFKCEIASCENLHAGVTIDENIKRIHG